MTVDANGIVHMEKITASMFDPVFLSQLSSLWSLGSSGNIYYNSGNVGILTNNPIVNLDVNGDVLADRFYIGNGQMTLTNTGSDAYWFSIP